MPDAACAGLGRVDAGSGTCVCACFEPCCCDEGGDGATALSAEWGDLKPKPAPYNCEASISLIWKVSLANESSSKPRDQSHSTCVRTWHAAAWRYAACAHGGMLKQWSSGTSVGVRRTKARRVELDMMPAEDSSTDAIQS